MLKKLRKILEIERDDKSVFDIVLFGSAVKGGEARDVDIVVIFLEGSLKERLDKTQELKSKLKSLEGNFDVKQIRLEELFSSAFFARHGILLDGVSLFKGKKFSEIMGFKAYDLFSYNLKGLTHNQKVKFNYILAGRNGTKGVLDEFGGTRIVNGAVKIPVENSAKFERVLEMNKVSFKKKSILEVM